MNKKSQNKLEVIKTFGNSMFPLLQQGDIIFLNPVGIKDIKLDDLISFKKNGVIITHRVVFIPKTKKYLITKGDKNFKAEKVLFKNILARVTKIKRNQHIINIENIYLNQSSLYFKELVLLVKRLNLANFNFVFLKGLPVNLHYEKSHPRRIYADCDILIQNDRFTDLKSLLRRLSYRMENNFFNTTFNKFNKNPSELSFSKVVSGFKITLDIHFDAFVLTSQIGKLNDIYPDQYINRLNNKLLEEKTTITLMDHKFPILSPDNLILYLSIHLMHHNYKGFYRYGLINTILEKSFIDFNKLSQIILELKLNNYLYPVFILINKHFKTSIPKKFYKQILPDSGSLNYSRKEIFTLNIFDEDSRLNEGINRFKYLFHLSPLRFKRFLVFISLPVIYAIYFSVMKKAQLYLLLLRKQIRLTPEPTSLSALR